MKKIYISIVLTTISALLVYLPETHTLLDEWRVLMSVATGMLAFVSFGIFLTDL